MYYQKKSKRGVGHIEIIISFLIFTAFVLFILFFFRPTDTNRLINTSIDYVFLELKRNASVDIEQYSFKINTELADEQIAISISDIPQESKSRAEDINGEVLESKRLGGVIEYYNGIDANYLELKKDFNLPDRINFGISLILEGDEVEEEIKTLKLPPEGLEVFTEKRRTQILMEDGKREFVDIEVTIW